MTIGRGSVMGDGSSMGMADSLGELLALEQIGDDRFRSRFNDSNLTGEIFGGQYLGQSLWAAMATAPGLTPQTLTAYFLRAADGLLPLDLTVERTRQGRRFAHRRVSIGQKGKEVFRTEVAFCSPDPAQPHHQRAMPAVPPLDRLQTLRSLAKARRDFLGEDAFARITNKRFFDTCPTEPDIGMARVSERPALRCWARVWPDQKLGPTPHYPALAYLSDNMANMASRAMYVANGFDNRLSALSLNHGLWFHAPPKADEWLLFDLDSHYAGGGIGSNRGFIHGADGRLHASFMQDAMIRWAQEEAP